MLAAATSRAAKRAVARQTQSAAAVASSSSATVAGSSQVRKNSTARLTAATSSYSTASSKSSANRTLATVSDSAVASPATQNARTHTYRVVVVGGGAAGQAVSHQLARSGVFPTGSSSRADILVIDPSEWHDYQPGWTLVGAGLKTKEELRRPMKDLFATSSADADDQSSIDHLSDAVETFEPEKNQLKTRDGRTIQYEQLVVCPGIHINWAGIEGLEEALKNTKESKVASIYSYDTCSEVFPLITSLEKGRAIFMQPSTVIKCAGAPQKAMWLALDHWKQQSQFNPEDPSKGVQVSFISGMPTMFAQPKYSKILDHLRQERKVEGLFQHDLTKIDVKRRVATFSRGEGMEPLEREYDLLHVVPRMGPLPLIKASPLANEESGFVDVDAATTQHKKFKNVWSIGDSSTLPTSKTAAAIVAEAPVLVANLLETIQGNGQLVAKYDGYTSCPLLTEYGKVLLAEFQGPGYGGQPKETFANLFGIDQGVPRRAFYHLKKDFFPWVYYNSHVKGLWQGPKGFLNPRKLAPTQQRGLHTSSRRPAFPANATGQRSFSTSVSAPRNIPARRPRDPLENDPTARRHRLPTGETFIVRPPPSAPSQYTTTLLPNPILHGMAPLAHSPGARRILPPPLKPNTKQAPSDAKLLTRDQILKMQALRTEDPNKYTASTLAAKFGCSSTFVRIAAPASTEVKQQREATLAAIKQTWSLRKRVSKAEKEQRRRFW